MHKSHAQYAAIYIKLKPYKSRFAIDLINSFSQNGTKKEHTMFYIRVIIGVLSIVFCLSSIGPAYAENKGDTVNIQSITAVLPVERIEPSIEFFKKIDFTTDQAVLEGDHIGFVIVKQGNTQLMYQTYSSIEADVGSLEGVQKGSPTNIYIVVDNINAVETALKGYEITLKRRKTFYGAEEIGYREPGGHLITFAEFAPVPE